jgi:hypothetical protein
MNETFGQKGNQGRFGLALFKRTLRLHCNNGRRHDAAVDEGDSRLGSALEDLRRSVAEFLHPRAHRANRLHLPEKGAIWQKL